MVADLVDHNQEINGHSITIGWLLESLRENDKLFQKLHGNRFVKEIKAYDISDGKGFASQILRCILTFSNSKSSSDVYTTILKIPGLEALKKVSKKAGEEEFKTDLNAGIIKSHNFECNFYQTLASIFDVPIPKIYKIQEWLPEKHHGCIHMEDLTRRGKNMSFLESVNLTQIKVFIRHLAHMHKNILSIDPKSWHGKHIKSHNSVVDMVGWMNSMVKPFFEKSEFKPLLDKYQKFLVNIGFHRYVLTQQYKDQNITPIIVHGDMHPGNIMWAIDENGDIQNDIASFIDWQTIFEGSPMFDLARFLSIAASGVVRRQAEEFAIDFYLECLVKEFDGDSTKVPYTKAQLQISYNYAFLTQVIMLVGGVIFVVDASKEKNELLKSAYWGFAELKALHALEDAERLLENQMKDVFEKYDV